MSPIPPSYRLVFDLISHPVGNPSSGWALMLGISTVSLVIFAAGVIRIVGGLVRADWSRAGRRAWTFTLFFMVFAGGWSTGTVVEAKRARFLRAVAMSRQFLQVEGCLDYFHPGLAYGTKTTLGNERWSVRGERFQYGAGEFMEVYHLVEPNGGAVHADSRVRVSYVPDPWYGHNDIVRLEVEDHSCLPAPDQAQQRAGMSDRGEKPSFAIRARRLASP